MYRARMRFSLVAVLLCLGFLSDTMAAPSIRKLGTAGSVGGKVTAVKSIDTGATVKATDENTVGDTDVTVKKATTSKPAMKGSVVQPSSRAASSRIGILGAKPVTKGTTLTGYETRFPSVSTKTGKIQSIYKPVVTTEPIVTNEEIIEKVTNLEIGLRNKADASELQNNYYTKDQINTGFYGTAYIDTKVSELQGAIDALDPVGISNLTQTVSDHTESINTLNGQATKVYDHATGKYTDVTIVTEFDDSILSSN